jgi:outer membrane protein assembly factor BamD (BamD/ComL family)
MLCAVQRNHRTDLYTGAQLSFKTRLSYAAVGIGESAARSLIESQFPFMPDVNSAQMMMIYALMHVRDRVDGVGGKSSVVTIYNNESHIVTGDVIEHAEKQFRLYESANAGLLRYVCGYLDEGEMDWVGSQAKKLRDAIKEVNPVIAQYPPYPTNGLSALPPSLESSEGSGES